MQRPTHPLSYYNRSKVPWEEEEVEKVKNAYVVDSMNIIEIGNIYKKTPGCISYKLKSLGIIVHNTLANGYKEYRESELYAEIVKDYKNKDEDKKVAREEKAKAKQEKAKAKQEKAQNAAISTTQEIPSKPTKISARNELATLKSDITEMKKNIKELLRLMNAVYDFQEEEAA